MPPIATRVVDAAGKNAVEAWIRALAPAPVVIEEPAPAAPTPAETPDAGP